MFSASSILVMAAGLGCALAGFLIAFRQTWLRRLIRSLSGRDPAVPLRSHNEGEDPVQYAMIIAGVMLMAFGLIIFAFVTSYAVLTAPG